MSESCETCRFWDDSRPVDGVGECRRYPPTTHFDADAVGVVTRTFALTAPDEWCGEHQPRGAEPEEPKAREPGWYWVKRGGTDHWQVAEWQAEWWLAGTDGPLDDEELIVIGRRLEPPA